MRSLLAAFLLLAAGLLSFPASLAVWEQQVLMDQDRFVKLGQHVLERDAVQAALTDRVQDEVVAVAVNAGADRGIASSLSRPIVRQLVSTLPQSPIGRTVLADSHRLMIGIIRDREAVQTDDGVIVLDLRVVVQQVLQSVGAAGLINLRAVPDSAGRILLVRERDVAWQFELARLFDGAAPYLIALPLLLSGLAVVVASNRALSITSAGIVLAACAAIRIGLLLGPVAGQVRDAALIDPAARDAAAATYDVLALSFVRQDIMVAAIGGGLFVVGLVLSLLKGPRPASRP